MESRSVPVSNEVRRPETSTSEMVPDWRILMEKSVMVTVQAFSCGEKPFYLWNQRGGRNIQKKLKTKEKSVGPVMASAALQIPIGASLPGARGASFRRGP